MFLKSLTISNGQNIIRKIKFHKGVNLIVDETISNDDTGNSVGKTTVLRLIYFCLGGKGENIYKDTEFKNKENNKIENFLKENNVLITLTLTPKLENARDIVIEKNFLARSKKILRINGKTITTKEFDKTLQELIFSSNSSKPTFRQIISKNIRDEKNRLSNTVKVLNLYATNSEYEALYLFWLGISTDSAAEKQKLILEQKALKRMISNIEKSGNYSQITQSLNIVESTIIKLEKKKKSYEVNANYEEDIKKLNGSSKLLSVNSHLFYQIHSY